MKKSILLAGLIAFTTVTAFAQEEGYAPPPPPGYIDINRVRFGAYLAPSISWMKPTTTTDGEKAYRVVSDGPKLGFTYGLMADYFFAPNYGVVTGLQITTSGGKIIANAIDDSWAAKKVVKADFNYNLQYLEIPLNLKLRTDDLGGFKLFGQLGLTGGINIAKKADYTVNYYDTGTALKTVADTKAKISGSFGAIAPILFSMNIGAGIEIPIANKLRFYAALFFNNGFFPDTTKPDLYDEKNLGYKGTFRDANTRLNNFALRLGLFF